MNLGEYRTKKLKNVFQKKFYILIFIFLLYNFLNIYFNQVYTSFGILTGFKIWFLIPFVLLTFLITPFLSSLTITLAIFRIKEAFSFGGTGVSAVGLFGGILGGACPGCLVGLFPAFLGLFGITGTSLSVLPLYGLEIQIISIALLIWAIFLLTKNPVCEIPKKKKS